MQFFFGVAKIGKDIFLLSPARLAAFDGFSVLAVSGMSPYEFRLARFICSLFGLLNNIYILKKCHKTALPGMYPKFEIRVFK